MKKKVEDFRFDYRKYKSKSISKKLLDQQMEAFTKVGASTFSKIVAIIQLVAFFAYIYARKRLIDEEMLIEKQDYEASVLQGNADDIGNDDLDG